MIKWMFSSVAGNSVLGVLAAAGAVLSEMWLPGAVAMVVTPGCILLSTVGAIRAFVLVDQVRE